MTRFRPQRIQGGVVAQGGLDLRERGSRRSLLRPEDRPFRALVLQNNVVGELGNVRGVSVECDVLLVRAGIVLHSVPVLQRQHGVNNVHDLWIPRATTRNMVDPSLPVNLSRTHSRRGTPIGAITPLGDVDGDHVLVDFIESNQDYPIIIGALPHERSNRVLRPGQGWREGESATRGNPRRDELYTAHYGSEIRINEQGDMLFDTVAAFLDASTESAAASCGQIRFRVKNGQRFTVSIGNDEDVLEVWKDGAQLRIDLGAGAAQRLVLGDDFRTFLNNFFSLFFDTHTHSGGTLPSGNTGPPLAAFVSPVRQDMGEALLSDLAKTKKT